MFSGDIPTLVKFLATESYIKHGSYCNQKPVVKICQNRSIPLKPKQKQKHCLLHVPLQPFPHCRCQSILLKFAALPHPVYVDKQERPWNTSSFDVGSGLCTGRKCCNIPVPTEATCLSSWAENHLRMTRTGRRTWKQCEPQYDSQSPRTDLTPLNHVDQHNDNLPQTNPHQPPCARDGRRASTAEDRMLKTWRSTFKSVH